MKTYGFVTVRVGSSRLNAKCLLKFGEGNVLEHIIRRAKYFKFTPVVCTTTEKEDDVIEKIAVKENCLVYRGSAEDKLQRWLRAAETFDVESFHTVDADDPFFDGELGHRSYKLLQEGYDIVHPSSTAYIGAVGYSITRNIIEKACAIKTSSDTEMMWYFIDKVPGLKKTELAVPDVRVKNLRLTLDYEEDYWLLSTVLRILGPKATRVEVEDLFVRNPDMYKVNWFRNEQWKNNQIEKGKAAD
jgi:spore coat polysaccharide biosynthesis protein SpsF (cytidylyltransferase family)